MPKEESGIERIGGKATPWTRHGSEDYWTITYGSHNATEAVRLRRKRIAGKERVVRGITLLVRHIRRGSSTWSVVYDGDLSLGKQFKNRMQGIIDAPAGRQLMESVDSLRHTPFMMDDPADPGRSFALFCLRLRKADEADLDRLVDQYIRWFGLLPFLADDIARGRPHYTDMLVRIIEAQGLRERERSLSKDIIDAALECANRLDRLPTKSEVREEYNSRHLHDGGLGNSEFSRALKLAGLGWLPVRL
jgi:hypothetical protein